MTNLFTYNEKPLEELLVEYEKDYEWEGGIPVVIKTLSNFREYETTLESPEYRAEWETTDDEENGYVLLDDAINFGRLILPTDFIDMISKIDIPELEEIVYIYKNKEKSFRDVINVYYTTFENDTYVCDLVNFVDEKIVKP